MTDDVPLQALLLLRKGAAAQIGASRVDLLRRIGETGSITAAAKACGLSYKGAWDAVQAMNNLSRGALVQAQTGGRGGGAAEVTEAGQALIAAFDRVSALLGTFAGQLEAALAGGDIGDLGSLGMKTSARNAYAGTVSFVRDGAVNAEVGLRIADGMELVATVTRESIEALGLKPGRPAMALIKSSFVLLAAGHDPLPVSARNRLKGVVAEVSPGAVNDEVTLDLGTGKTVTAVITRESRQALKLEVGQPAQALIKASHILLAVD
jgi:molybdate transport system regulatory protein